MWELKDCIVLHSPALQPHHCRRFEVQADTVTAIELDEPCLRVERPTWVVMPGMYNSHTHMGDVCLPDGATGMTLEAGFFRPHGFKYRELAKRSESEHLEQMTAHLHYMARSGTVGHIDFREQGVYGCQLLRRASEATGVRSLILGQFNTLPFTEAQLRHNNAPLSPEALVELDALLAVADGFSESTMNDLTDAAWQQIRQMTRSRNKLRAIHCLENEGYREMSLAIAGRGDLERAIDLFEPHLVIHATVANDSEIALLSQNRINVVLNPRANANLGLPLPPIAKLLESNANCLLGTDNGMLNSPNLFAELDFTYKIAKSQFGDAIRPNPIAILQMVTSNIRHLLGTDTCGYLEVGCPADFVLLDFTQPHLRHSHHIPAAIVTRVTPEDVLATVRQGKMLYRRSEVEVIN